MISEIPVPQSGQMWSALCKPVIAMARAINGLRNLRFEQSPDSDWHFTWDEGGAVFQYPDNSGDGNALGPVWIDVAVNGIAMYMQVNGSAPVASLPAGASVVNPD